MKSSYLLVAGIAIALAGCASTVRTVKNLNPFTPSTSFQEWDTNDDGVLSQREASEYQPVASNFQRIDSNSDGNINENEYAAATTFLSSQPGFSSYDLDGNGFITEQEADAAPRGGLQDVFDDVDADEDGNVSNAEFAAATVNLLGGVSFASLDTDGDGAISGDEAESRAPLLWQEFDRVDLDGDDQISKNEYNTFQQGASGNNRKRSGNIAR
ncbi:MAG TPA: hypothetical protein VFL45_06275 [Gammaproteobacteria bacterium]|nr:hypothetical protein [Gammaproteobacteria bacterium]HET7587671.1 hypothetical protein [Gammaproteobacteria bacterium]